MATRAPYTPFGKKMKVAMIEQGIPQQELAKQLRIANSAVSDIIYGRDQRERTEIRVTETLEIH